MSSDPSATRSGGLFGSVRRFVRSLLRLLQTRLEILSTEIAEERFNLARMALVALCILFCFQSGTFLGVLFIVLAVAEEHRLAAIGIAALALLTMAIGGALWLWWWLKSRPPLFAATIAELRRDRERLGGGS